MNLPTRTLTPAELAARRGNAKKSTGPRTAAGKRRSALNSLKKNLCPLWRALLLPPRGPEYVREYRRLHRDLVALFRPGNSFFRHLVAMLAEVWWDKVWWLRGQTWGPTGWPTGRKLDQEIESRLMTYVTALSLQTRKWNARLSRDLGGEIASPYILRNRIEARLTAFRTDKGIMQVVQEDEEIKTPKRILPGKIQVR